MNSFLKGTGSVCFREPFSSDRMTSSRASYVWRIVRALPWVLSRGTPPTTPSPTPCLSCFSPPLFWFPFCQWKSKGRAVVCETEEENIKLGASLQLALHVCCKEPFKRSGSFMNITALVWMCAQCVHSVCRVGFQTTDELCREPWLPSAGQLIHSQS